MGAMECRYGFACECTSRPVSSRRVTRPASVTANTIGSPIFTKRVLGRATAQARTLQPWLLAYSTPGTRRGGANPRFRLHLVGGVQSTSNCVPSRRNIDGPRIRLGHWYSVLEHVVFSPSRKGLVQIWIDGRKMASVHFPTVYQHPNGSVGQYYFGFGYYRLRSSWDATVLFDNVAEGPTKASVARTGRKLHR